MLTDHNRALRAIMHMKPYACLYAKTQTWHGLRMSESAVEGVQIWLRHVELLLLRSTGAGDRLEPAAEHVD